MWNELKINFIICFANFDIFQIIYSFLNLHQFEPGPQSFLFLTKTYSYQSNLLHNLTKSCNLIVIFKMSQIQTPAQEYPQNQAPGTSKVRNTNNIIFAIVLIAYEILALPIFGKLFGLNVLNDSFYDYGGILLVSISTILLIIGRNDLSQVWDWLILTLLDLRFRE